MTIDRNLYARLRKRILMFYFAAGINLLMALWVLSVGAGKVEAGTLWLIVLIFLAFTALNFYMARTLKKQWDNHVRQNSPPPTDEATKNT